MALPLPQGLTPAEVALLCEMEMVTVIPRQRLDKLELLGVSRSSVQVRKSRTVQYVLALKFFPAAYLFLVTPNVDLLIMRHH